jgi:hypothetical protein
MSSVVAVYGCSLVIGADHGIWNIAQDGTPYNGRVMPESKLIEIPGLPVVIGSVGKHYPGLIEQWVASQAFAPTSYSCRDIAKRLTEYVFAIHRPVAERALWDAGIDPATATFEDANERSLGAQEIVVVGFDRGNGWAPQCWKSEYPSFEPERFNVRKFGFTEHLQGGLLAIGYNEPLKALWADSSQEWLPNVGRLNEMQCIDLCRFALNVVERFESWKPKGKQCVFGPFDLAVIRADGVHWIDRPFVDYVPERDAGAEDRAASIPRSTPLNTAQGSIPPIGTPAVTATAGPTSITLSIPAATFYLPDGSVVSVNAWNYTIGTLQSSTTYHFNVAYNLGYNGTTNPVGSYEVVTFPQSAALSQQQMAAVYADGLYPITSNASITTQSSGGTGGGGFNGGGGGGCPAADQPIETLERGIIPAGDLEVGMHLRSPNGEWVPILATRIEQCELVRVRAGDEDFRVEAYHLWRTVDGWKATHEIAIGDLLESVTGDAVPVQAIERLGVGDYRRLHVRGGEFRLGHLIGHNVVTL